MYYRYSVHTIDLIALDRVDVMLDISNAADKVITLLQKRWDKIAMGSWPSTEIDNLR